MVRDAVYSAMDAWDTLTGKKTDLTPPRRLMNVGSSSVFRNDFAATGKTLLRHLADFGGLRPSDRVLDVGCGVGRVAIPMTGYLTTGAYDGFDNVRESIEFCERTITPKFPHFRFKHANIRNSMYNPGGVLEPHEFVFPYQDGVFDFSFLTSVFTHMQQAEVEHYVAELARTLNGGGRIFATFFLLDDASEAAIRNGLANFTFEHQSGVARVQDAQRPDRAVAYPESYVVGLFRRNGFRVERMLRGSWSAAADSVGYQDALVAVKG